ncbi:MAG: hypothetical protein C4547_02490 [Phycisphaerales bacterium]|nr:MAG: hypothetical protein C4547_02490 [Phycisphaerales bacterium]
MSFPHARERLARLAHSLCRHHVAFMYEEIDAWAMMGVTFPIMLGGAEQRIRRNRLLILLDRHAGVVDEFGYREEFKAR